MQETLPFLSRTLDATAAGTVATVLVRLMLAAALGGAIGVSSVR